MASKIFNASNLILKAFHRLRITSPLNSSIKSQPILYNSLILPIRHTSFFNKLPAEEIWKGITSVSNAGKKRGRGRGVKGLRKDLNRGQVIGVGKANMVWPGLNSPVIRGKELVQQQKLPEDPEREAKLQKLRDEMGNFRSLRLNPIERGWSGNRMPGRSIGPPDPVGDDCFEGFDSRVLEMKMVVVMKGNLGRKRRQSVFTVTGNRDGLAGFALAKAIDGRAALRKSKNRAAQKLIHIDLWKGHTVNHDFFCQFGATKIYVTKQPEGYGLRCHRAIKTICEVIGIKDLYAKVEGSTNVQHITKAFFSGLLQQRTYEQMAEDKRLHIVEFQKTYNNFPRVIASPVNCRRKEEIRSEENMNFQQYCLNDRIVLKKMKFPPFFTKHKSWGIYCKRQEKVRDHDKVRLDMMVHYGELRSFMTDKYPECAPKKNPKKSQLEEPSE